MKKNVFVIITNAVVLVVMILAMGFFGAIILDDWTDRICLIPFLFILYIWRSFLDHVFLLMRKDDLTKKEKDGTIH